MTKEALISFSNVWKTYAMGTTQIHAVKDVSLEVKKGEFLAVIGPSGAGKSTMMNLIGCLDTPSRGTIRLGGKDIAKLHESDLARIRGKMIGFVFQQFNLMPTLTALENVMLPMMFQGMPRDMRVQRAEQLLAQVGLTDRMYHTPGELSGGQRQRVAIARALANHPEVILADEPTGNLDSATGKEVVQMLCEINERGGTIVLVTHDQELIKHATRVIFLMDGGVEKVIKKR